MSIIFYSIASINWNLLLSFPLVSYPFILDRNTVLFKSALMIEDFVRINGYKLDKDIYVSPKQYPCSQFILVFVILSAHKLSCTRRTR